MGIPARRISKAALLKLEGPSHAIKIHPKDADQSIDSDYDSRLTAEVAEACK